MASQGYQPNYYATAPPGSAPGTMLQFTPGQPLPPGTYQFAPLYPQQQYGPPPPGGYGPPPPPGYGQPPPPGYGQPLPPGYGPPPPPGFYGPPPPPGYGPPPPPGVGQRTRQDDTMKNIGIGALLASLLCCCCFADDVIDGMSCDGDCR